MRNEFDEKYQAVRELAIGDLDDPAGTTLYEWMRAGYWQTMGADEIAQEWNELTRQAEEEERS